MGEPFWMKFGLKGPLQTTEQALQAVEQWGFCHVLGKSGSNIPSLWRCARDPGWDSVGPWINELAAERKVYSANVIGGMASIVSLELLPAFCALLHPVSLEHEYEMGRLTPSDFNSGAAVLEALAENEPLTTTDIGPLSGLMKGEVQAGLKVLQRYALVAKVGVRVPNWVVQIWSPVEREFPDQVRAADEMTPEQGASEILGAMAGITGVTEVPVLVRLMRWKWAFDRVHLGRILLD